MCPARRRGSFQGRQSVRRLTGWEEGIGSVGEQTSLSSSTTILVSSGLSILEDGFTLVRTRGSLLLQLGTADAQGSGYAGAFGIGVATTPAFVAGAGAVPGPITEQDWDGWLYWAPVQLTAAGVITAVANTAMDAQTGVQRIDFDSKAMRKLTEDDTIYGALEVTEVATATLRWRCDSRMLFKLP